MLCFVEHLPQRIRPFTPLFDPLAKKRGTHNGMRVKLPDMPEFPEARIISVNNI